MNFRVLLAAVVVLAFVAPVAPGVGTAAADAGQSDTCSFPVTLTDATGTEVTIGDAPERVVVLGASAAQTVWELGAADRVVGIDSFSTYLEGATEVPVVSQGIGAVQYEAALDQDPDLILVAGNSYSDDVVQEFRKSNVTTVKLADASSLSDIYAVTNQTGRLVGECSAAQTTVEHMQERVAVVDRTVELANDRPTIFYPLGGGYTVGPGSFINDVLTRVGAQNIVAEGNFSAYPQVSNEFILEQDPSWLLATYNPAFGQNASNPRALLPANDAINQTQAYQSGNIVVVDANEINQPAPRIVEAMVTIAQTLHPEAYAQANRTATTTTVVTTSTSTPTETSTASPTVTTAAPSPTPGGDGGGIPGFGPLVAVLALTIAVAGLRRR